MTDLKTIAVSYVEAAGTKDLERISELLANDLTFVGPTSTYRTAAEVVAALRRLTAIHVRNDIKRVFVDGDEACVIYDFVTDTAIGAVPTVEWLRIEGGRIRSIHLFYDRVPWQTVLVEMQQRAAQPRV
jgi:hypothetical protein